jgi:hypothetical protein
MGGESRLNGRKGQVYVFLVTRPVEKRPVGAARRRWEDMIERDIKGIRYQDVGWVNRPAEGRWGSCGHDNKPLSPIKWLTARRLYKSFGVKGLKR